MRKGKKARLQPGPEYTKKCNSGLHFILGILHDYELVGVRKVYRQNPDYFSERLLQEIAIP